MKLNVFVLWFFLALDFYCFGVTDFDDFRAKLKPLTDQSLNMLDSHQELPKIFSAQGESITKPVCLEALQRVKANYPTSPFSIILPIEKQVLQFPFCNFQNLERAAGEFLLPNGAVAAEVLREKQHDTVGQVVVKRSVFLSQDAKLEAIQETTTALTDKRSSISKMQYWDREQNAQAIFIEVSPSGEVLELRRSFVSHDGMISSARLVVEYFPKHRRSFSMQVPVKQDWNAFWIALPFVLNSGGIYEYNTAANGPFRSIYAMNSQILKIVTEDGKEICAEGNVRDANVMKRVPGSSAQSCK